VTMAGTSPIVSVIIPTYNACNVIRETLASVAAQTMKDVEVIVVDDGSTDGSADLVCEHPQVTRCIRQDNRGVAAARNRGMQESSGRYLALLDHDDLWAPDKLQKQTSILDARPAVGMVITNVVHIDRDGRPTGEVGEGYNPSDPFYRLFTKGYVPTPSSAMIRRTVLQQAGGFDEVFGSAGMDDHDLWPRIAVISDIANVDEPLTFHRQSYIKPTLVGLEHRCLLIEKMRRAFPLTLEQDRFLLLQEAAYWGDLGKWLVREGRRREGRARLMQGARLALKQGGSSLTALRCLSRLVRSFF